jgi:signal transduction histidine kinase
VALSLLALGAGAISIGWHASTSSASLAAKLTAGTFAMVSGVLLAWSALTAWAGRAIRRRKPWARLVALVLSVLHLFILPFGTALGAYALWVLVHNEARHEFEPTPAGH